MRKFLKRYPVSIFTILIILYLSFFTPPKESSIEIPYIDKVVHFCMYGGLSGILWLEHLWHHHTPNWKHLIIGGIICPIVMSGLIEIGQSTLTETRSGEWMDFVANTSGVIVASIIGYYIGQPLVKKYKH